MEPFIPVTRVQSCWDWHRALFDTMFSTLRSRQPDRPLPARPSYVSLSISIFVHRRYIPFGLLRDCCP